MKFNTYDITPRIKEPKRINGGIVFFVALYTAVLLWLGADRQSVVLIIILGVAFLGFTVALIARDYDARKAYFEVENGRIRLIDYPFFKQRERVFSLYDIKQVKWKYKRGTDLNFLIFKNQQK